MKNRYLIERYFGDHWGIYHHNLSTLKMAKLLIKGFNKLHPDVKLRICRRSVNGLVVLENNKWIKA